MKGINKSTELAILKKTPWAHSVRPHQEGLNEDDIKGLFYKAITDKENSIISEINRIVDECNQQFADIDITEYVGRLTDHPNAKEQKWQRVNKLLFAYELPQEYNLLDIKKLSNILNLSQGFNLILRLYAPNGVVPDEELSITIGNAVFNGLEILSNSSKEAFDDIYYIDFAVPKIGSLTELSIKWNSSLKNEKFFVDFLYTRGSDKELFIRYADDENGTNISDTQLESNKYLGLYYGDGDSSVVSNYAWIKLMETTVTWYECTTTIGDFRGKNSIEISLPYANPKSYIISSPNIETLDEYIRCGIYCSLTDNGKVKVECSELPEKVIKIIFLIGNKS